MAPGDRMCLVCRSPVLRDDSLRLVVSPEGKACIDWKRKLPGHGASCCWTRQCLEGLGQAGRLQRAFGRAVEVPEDEWPMSAVREHGTRRQCELVGLAGRAGELKAGQEVMDRFLRRGWPRYLVRAADCRQKTSILWQGKVASRGLPILESSLDSAAMGAALGRKGPRSIVALGQGPIARALHSELKRQASLL